MFYKFQKPNLGVEEFLLLVQMKVVVDLAEQVVHPHWAEHYILLHNYITSPTRIGKYMSM